MPARELLPSRAVVVAALVFIAVYVALDFNKLYALRYGADTGTFLQWFTGELHGWGSWNGAEYRPHLQVHDSWVLLALVPLVGIFPYAQTLLIVQVIAIAAAAPVVYAFARQCGAVPRAATAVALAYLLAPSAQGIAYGNFIENVFVPLLGALAALGVARRNVWLALVPVQLLLGLKEDQALFALWFGAAVALWWDRRLGLGIAGLALVNGIAFVAFEHLSGAHPSIPSYGLHVEDVRSKLEFFAALLLPFAFAPLWLGPRLVLAVPLVAELIFNGPWAYQIARIGTHWTAPIFIAAALAAAYVVARRPRFATPMLVLAALASFTINDTVIKPGRWPYVVDWAAYARATALRATGNYVLLPRTQEGAYAVAAASHYVLLGWYDPREHDKYCPAYDTDARAFFASLGLAPAPVGMKLCGGVPVYGAPAR